MHTPMYILVSLTFWAEYIPARNLEVVRRNDLAGVIR